MTIAEYTKRLDQEKTGHEVAIEGINVRLSIARRILSNQYNLEKSPERHFQGDWYGVSQLRDPVYERLEEITHRNAASVIRDPKDNDRIQPLMAAMLNRTMKEEVYTQILEGKHPDVPKRNLYERLNRWFIGLQERFDKLWLR